MIPGTSLVDQEVKGPDQYRYYPRGHVHYRYPIVTENTTFLYRFESKLVNAVHDVEEYTWIKLNSRSPMSSVTSASSAKCSPRLRGRWRSPWSDLSSRLE